MYKKHIGDYMLCNRIKQFREYNQLEPEMLAQLLGISLELYNAYEEGQEKPTIDIIDKLARVYKVTVDEFYGFTPRLQIYDESQDRFFENDVEEKTLKLSDLSWDEVKLILHYRTLDDIDKKEAIISEIIQGDK